MSQETEVSTETSATVPQRPENVPEKFWNAETGAVNTEALLQSYVELERARSANTAEEAPTENPSGTPQEPTEENPSGTPPEPGEEKSAYTQAVERATAELAESETLSDETYAAFEAQGIAREQVDTYIEGQRAMYELRKISAESEAGGADAYAAMLSWAGANYSPEDAEAFNAAVFGANKDAALQAVRGLKTKYEEAMGSDGKIVTNGTGTSAPGGYANKSEWLADIRKPEYKTDPGFRDQVRRKLGVALQNGVNLGVSTGAT